MGQLGTAGAGQGRDSLAGRVVGWWSVNRVGGLVTMWRVE